MSAAKEVSQWILNFVQEALELRAFIDEAEGEFFKHIASGETQDHEWRTGGFASWDEFLKTYNICDVARYRNYKAAIETCGESFVNNVGVKAAVITARIEEKTARDKVVVQLEAMRRQSGTTPSEQNVQSVVHRYVLRTSRPRVLVQEDKMLTQDQEIKLLRAENAKLKEQVQELKKRLAETGRRNSEAMAKAKRKH